MQRYERSAKQWGSCCWVQRGPITSDPIQAMVIEVELQHYSVLAERVIAQTEKRVLGAEFGIFCS